MDVLKPELLWVEGRCYRINFQDPTLRGETEDEFYVNENVNEDVESELQESCEPIELETTENGRVRTTFHIPKFYFGMIVGYKGNTRSKLENETKTQIRIPRQGQNGDIIITGDSRSGVLAARRRIELIVMTARQKQQFTHFISIPMTAGAIQERFLKFKDQVLEKCKSRGVEACIFQTPQKLHLTLCTLVLMDNDERELAAQALRECKEMIIDPLLGKKELRVRMVGVEYMNDDPAEVDVLYGKVQAVDGGQVLQQLADSLVDFFASKGLSMKQYERVKLHATLMNTLFREDKGGVSELETSKGRRRPRESFDATAILKDYEEFDFGEQRVSSIHLSQRYSTAANSGYYQASSKLNLCC